MIDQSKTYQTAMVLTPPKECWPPIQEIRERYDSHVWRWMPHVNLVYPFRPRSTFDRLEGPLREALRAVEPFRVSLETFYHFHHGRDHYTLWLAPDPKDALVRLQAALEAVVPDCNDVSEFPGGFTPHLSVGQVRGKVAMEKLKAGLQLSWKPLTFTARQVAVIQRGRAPDDIFRFDRFIDLGPDRA